MPKASREQTLKVKLQARALFELGKYTLEEICEAIKKSGGSVSRQTLAKWINEDANDVWQIRNPSENRIYDAQKIVHKEKIMKQFKKQEEQIKDDIITKQATVDATQEAIVLVNLEKERNKLTKETLENAYIVNQYILDLVKKGRTAKMVEEDIVSFGGVKTGEKKQTKTVEEHKIPEVVRASEMIIKTLYGLGVLQTTPTVAMQVNNTNAQQNNNTDIKVETQFSKISEQEAFQEFCKKIAK
jgi:hypothetical protein